MLTFDMIQTPFLIIGAGIAGLSMAIALDQLCIDYIICEAAPNIRGIGAGFGLASNAITAFESINLDLAVKQIGFEVTALDIVNEKGVTIISGKPSEIKGYDAINYTLHRADLHKLLLSKIDEPKILTNKRVTKISKNNNQFSTVMFEDGTVIQCDYLIGADGVGSTVRQLIFPNSTPRYAGYTCWRAIIKNASFKTNKSLETWGAAGRFGITPLIDNQIYWYACINAAPNDSKYKSFIVEDLLHQFKNYHPAVIQILQETKDQDLIHNDIVDIDLLTQYHQDNILLIGDAAHATTPNLGQGACLAIEDVAVLKHLLSNNNISAEVFKLFTAIRKPKCDYIVRTSKSLGKVAQIDHSLMVPLRNLAMRSMPKIWRDHQMKKILTFSVT